MMMMACSENVQSVVVRMGSNPLTCYFSVFILIMGTARWTFVMIYGNVKTKKKYDRDEPRIAMTNTRLDCSKKYLYTFFWWIKKKYV